MRRGSAAMGKHIVEQKNTLNGESGRAWGRGVFIFATFTHKLGLPEEGGEGGWGRGGGFIVLGRYGCDAEQFTSCSFHTQMFFWPSGPGGWGLLFYRGVYCFRALDA